MEENPDEMYRLDIAHRGGTRLKWCTISPTLPTVVALWTTFKVVSISPLSSIEVKGAAKFFSYNKDVILVLSLFVFFLFSATD